MAQRTSYNQSKFKYGESQDDFQTKIEPEDEDAFHTEDKDIDFIQKLLKEKMSLDKEKYPNILRLINREVDQSQKSKSQRDFQYVDIYREKPIKLSAKVLVPVKVHPNFNFVGKLLGPKGNSLKRLQEETLTRMFILGRGSMKDKEKEEELRQSLEPKYAHLCDDLHVEISVLAPPAEAHARMAYALAEIRKYLIPDYYDEIRKEQMQEILAEQHPVGQIKATMGRGRGVPAASAPMPNRGGRTAPPFAGKSVLHSVRQRAAAYSSNYYGNETDKWQNYNDYGNGRASMDYYKGNYSGGGASPYNGYNNFAANNTNNGRNSRRPV